MVGICFPGISQLFVAATQPPSLAAITPLSVLDDAYRSTLYPGGILNTGFAVPWLTERVEESKPYGQGWTKERADAGDTMCADNQKMRLQNPDILAEVEANPYLRGDARRSDRPGHVRRPDRRAGVHRRRVAGRADRRPLPGDARPVQRLAARVRDAVNGLHTESISPAVFPRLVEFLDLYVGRRVPSLGAARADRPDPVVEPLRHRPGDAAARPVRRA